MLSQALMHMQDHLTMHRRKDVNFCPASQLELELEEQHRTGARPMHDGLWMQLAAGARVKGVLHGWEALVARRKMLAKCYTNAKRAMGRRTSMCVFRQWIAITRRKARLADLCNVKSLRAVKHRCASVFLEVYSESFDLD